ncbi:MAG: hypothetical protein ACRD2G_01285, partial [Terriglobia bacterium]
MKIDNPQTLPMPRFTWPVIRQRIADYWMMTKPEVNFLVVASSLVGFYLGTSGPLRLGLLLNTLFGTLLVASGTATL